MPIVIHEFVVDTPPPEAAAADQARAEQGAAAAPPAPAWAPELARRLERELTLAAERALRLLAD